MERKDLRLSCVETRVASAAAAGGFVNVRVLVLASEIRDGGHLCHVPNIRKPDNSLAVKVLRSFTFAFNMAWSIIYFFMQRQFF